MGTVIEASSMQEALSIVELAYEQLDGCERVYSSLKFDIRKNCENRLKTKIESVEKVLNRKVSHYFSGLFFILFFTFKCKVEYSCDYYKNNHSKSQCYWISCVIHNKLLFRR